MAKKKGKIKINPKNKGTFTKWCKSHGYGGVNDKCIKAAKNSGNPKVVKKATFAANAKKWNHKKKKK